MSNVQLRQAKRRIIGALLFVFGFCCVFSGRTALCQVDQGAINGVVKDPTGAVIPNAEVTLTNTDTNFVLQGKTDAKGEYSFAPIKIGHYSVSASAPGFETTTQQNVRVNIQDRLSVDIALKPGGAQETVTVTSAPPMLQNESSAVGQVMDTDAINATPLNGRNWVYIAQLTAGVAPGLSAGGARGGGTGDFSANGQRTTQNNFILDGVDNNVNVDDFQNGASYNVRPPPDALAEFKIDTSNYSAEFGHSAGAVLSASIKSGSNKVHGDAWEYIRNNDFDAADWTSSNGVVPAYHENQFGATLGGPLWKNKLFYFGDAEANRIRFADPDPGLTVPTASMRSGDFSEYFNGSLNSAGEPITIFAPNTGGQLPLTQTGGAIPNPAAANAALCSAPVTDTNLQGTSGLCAWNPTNIGTSTGGFGPATTNVLTPGDPSAGGMMDIVAGEILNDYPKPNAGGWNSSNYNTPGSGQTYRNYNVNVPVKDNTFQWDQRLDWNPNAKDQAYVRYSYTHEQLGFGLPLGPILDGNEVAPGGFHGSTNFNLAENFMASETHVVSPSLINEFRFGYNWGDYEFVQANNNVPANQLVPGLGGVPFTGYAGPNGGLPELNISGFSRAGSRHDVPSIERQNIYQILDNVTKSAGPHSIKVGIQLESIRTAFAQSVYPRGRYGYFGEFTGQDDVNGNGTPYAGSGGTDLFTNNMGNVALSPGWDTQYYRNYRAAYFQDDWKVNSKLTLNLGLRYDFIQPDSSKPGDVANLVIDSQGLVAPGSGVDAQSATGVAHYVLPQQVASSAPLSAGFVQGLAAQHIDIQYTNANPNSLVGVQHYNFAPRIGASYQIDPKTVVRTGYGLFYGSIEAPGGAELETNYPFAYQVVLYNNYLGAGGPCFPSTQGGYSNANSTCPSTGTPESPQTVANLGGINTLPYPATLETGMSLYLANGGIGSFANASAISMSDSKVKTTYTEAYNLSVEREVTRNMVASVGYVGNVGKHTYASTNPLGALAVTSSNNPNSNQGTNAFPNLSFSANGDQQWIGESKYNGLQAKLQQRYANGMDFLASYTWSHAEDDAQNPGIGGGPASRNTNLIPLKYEMTNSNYDTRHRFTFNGMYELPFGNGRKYMHQGGALDYLVGGWSASATWTAQTGIPFTISNGGGKFVQANGFGMINAIRVGDPFKGGGTPLPANIDMQGNTCPARVKTKANWYNPCAFVDPLPGGNIPVGTFLTDMASAIQYSGSKSNQIHGPGWERANMSAFKNFKVWHEQYVQFRADAFNLFNTPSWGNPGTTDLSTNAGQITNSQQFQNYTPDARFFQLATKYVF